MPFFVVVILRSIGGFSSDILIPLRIYCIDMLCITPGINFQFTETFKLTEMIDK